MEHDEIIEAIELAALEPGGLDRLMAGDTATSQLVAGHLAGCPACAAVLAATDRESRIVADVVATTPTAALRARTLATVQLRGVRRGEEAAEPATVPVALLAEPVTAPLAEQRAPRGGRTLAWIAAIAATILLSVGVTTAVLTSRMDAQIAAQADTIADLRQVAEYTVRVASAPDATSVALVGTQDPAMSGSIVFSPTSTELSVVATGLTEPPVGQEFSCWMDTGSGRVRIGKMFFGGGLAYWVGPSAAVAGLTAPAAFGVSLVDVGAPVDSPPVLVGRS